MLTPHLLVWDEPRDVEAAVFLAGVVCHGGFPVGEAGAFGICGSGFGFLGGFGGVCFAALWSCGAFLGLCWVT